MHDISDMAVFVEVAQAGGFSADGRRLGLATSVVSGRVRHLEDRLGIKLLNRTTRSQTLTESGAAYLERATHILADIQSMEASVVDASSCARGDLRITAPGPLGRQQIAPLVADFCRDHPQIRVHLTLDDRFSDIAAEGFDIAFRGGPMVDSQFTGRRLFETRRVVVASPAYLQRAGRPERPDDLPGHRCLVFNSESIFSAQWRFGRSSEVHSVRVDAAMASTQSELPVTWALAGLGLTQKSFWEVASHLADGSLQTVLDAYEPEPVSFFAIHPVRVAQSRKVGLFIDAAVTWFDGFGEP